MKLICLFSRILVPGFIPQEQKILKQKVPKRYKNFTEIFRKQTKKLLFFSFQKKIFHSFFFQLKKVSIYFIFFPYSPLFFSISLSLSLSH